MINELIQYGEDLFKIGDLDKLVDEYEIWCNRAALLIKKGDFGEEAINDLKVAMHYTKNEYSKEDTQKSILGALRRSIYFLQELSEVIPTELSLETALAIIEKILKNFYLFYRAMYKNPLHKRGTLTPEILEAVRIGNEYDLQRMLCSLLLPMFPTIRQEAFSDNGYGGMRADLYLAEYNIIIETKCTRDSMSEKRLLEELGADAFLYPTKYVFILVYDPANIIKIPEALKRTFAREAVKDGKQVKLFLIQQHFDR